MEDKKNMILVSWDFTKISEYALEHAIRVAKITGNGIAIISIAESKKEVDNMTTIISKVAADESKKHGIAIGYIIRTGSIFKKIKSEAEEMGAMLVVMGTHGIKGMQKFLGSKALKVISGSKVPFLVVQEPPSKENYKNIVLPMDFSVESKEKLKWASYLAKYFNSTIKMYVLGVKEETALRKTKANVAFAKKYFEEKLTYYDVTVSKKTSDFSKQIIEFAEESDADIILIMTTRDLQFIDYVFGATEQQIIANNSKIPVLCVNPRTDLRKLGGFH